MIFLLGKNREIKGCFKQITIEDGVGGIVNFVISPTTYFVNQEIVTVGDAIISYFDGDAPVPLIYPPQYSASLLLKKPTIKMSK